MHDFFFHSISTNLSTEKCVTYFGNATNWEIYVRTVWVQSGEIMSCIYAVSGDDDAGIHSQLQTWEILIFWYGLGSHHQCLSGIHAPSHAPFPWCASSTTLFTQGSHRVGNCAKSWEFNLGFPDWENVRKFADH